MPDLSKKLKTVWFDFRTDLPQWISVGIGQAAAEWSVLERELEEIIRILIDGDIAHSRIVTNRMNVRTRIATIKSLLEWYVLHGKKLKASDRRQFAKISKKADQNQTNRDMLAHGLWCKFGPSWHVLQVRQTRNVPELRPALENLTRATLPQRQKITRLRLRSICRQIVSLSRRYEKFGKRLERALAPLRSTPPQYSRRRPPYR
jgi:hypothetical protein